MEFFEGLDGVKKVLEDSLTANTAKEICAFSDIGSYMQYLGDWNKKYYAPKRKALGVRLRGIVPNSPQALEFLKGYQATEVTQTLLIDHRLYSFTTEVNIYDNKVSFVTFSERAHIGVIITNEEIYKTFKTLFEFMWTFTKEYSKTLQPGWLTPPSSNPPPSSGAPTLLA